MGNFSPVIPSTFNVIGMIVLVEDRVLSFQYYNCVCVFVTLVVGYRLGPDGETCI